MTESTQGASYGPIEPAQRIAARVAGAILLLAMASAMFAELYALGGLLVAGDPAQTARNYLASERLVRIGAAVHLLTFVSDAAIAVALYIVLRRVNRGMALFGAFLRLVDCAILALSTLALLTVLRLLGGSDYLRPFAPEELQGLARLLLAVRADAMSIGWVFLGLGQAVFAWLWLRSRYIPRALAAWGILASLLLALVPLALMVFPEFRAAAGMTYMVPMFFYEVPLGVWLLVKGLREPAGR